MAEAYAHNAASVMLRPLELTLEEKVAALSAPECYGRPGARVDARQTHMSWVFIVGDLVFKLKKPVRFPFLDFRRLADRERFVREEVRLNRRLAPSVYLGVSALTLSPDGGLSVDGPGAPVEWLVRMRRLPEERFLDAAILSGSVDRARLARVFERLAVFYASQPRPSIQPEERVERFRAQYQEDAVVLLDPLFALDGDRIAALLDRCEDDLSLLADRLSAQCGDGTLVDGHGDLRPEHICLTSPPEIIDRLEFDAALRRVDPFEEAALLGLECARLGAPWIAEACVSSLAARLGRRLEPDLYAFYWRSKALLRARLSLAHLLDARPRTPEKWRPLTLSYLDLAGRVAPLARRCSARAGDARASAGNG